MSDIEQSTASASGLGFWSSLIILAEVVTFALALLLPDALMLAFLASFFLAPTFVALMVAIHYSTPQEKQVWSHLGLAFATIYAVLSSLSYYLQLTVVRTNSLGAPAEMLELFAFKPGSVIFAQDMLGYTFMTLAMLMAAPVFGRSRLAIWIRGLFIGNGLLVASSLGFPVLPIPQDSASAAATNQFGTLANLAWCAMFALVAVLLAGYFRRSTAPELRRSARPTGISLEV